VPVPGQPAQSRQRVLTERFTAAAFVKDSTVISALSFLGVAGAFLFDVVVAAKYGLGHETDAFYVAIAIPQLIFSISSSSGPSVLTPVFTRLLDEKGEAETCVVFNTLNILSLAILSVLGGAGVFLSPVIVAVAGAGLEEPSASLAVSLSRILFLMLIPIGLIQIMKAFLNARNHFATPAAATLIQYSIILITLLVLAPTLGIAAVAVGYVLGMVGQVLVLGVAVYVKGGSYRPVLRLRHPVVRRAAGLLAPPLSGELLAQSVVVIERALASFLAPGSVSALAYAGRILRASDILFLTNVVVAGLPRLSSLATARDFDGFKRFMSLGLKLAWAITIPLTAVILALNGPIVSLVFQRGAFDAQDALVTARVLCMYMLGFPALTMLRMLLTSFYALQDTKTPFFIRTSMLGQNLVGDLLLMSLIGVPGLALSTAMTYFVHSIPAARLLRRKIGPLKMHIGAYLGKSAVAACAMGMTALVVHMGLREMFGKMAFPGQILAIGAAVLLGGIVYVATMAVLRTGEFRQFVGSVLSRLPLARN
jgi:putative peptidoglycan lipid II flippase